MINKVLLMLGLLTGLLMINEMVDYCLDILKIPSNKEDFYEESESER